MRLRLSFILIGLALTGCFKLGPTSIGKIDKPLMIRSGTPVESTMQFEEGSDKASAEISIDSKFDTLISAPSQSALAGSSIVLSPGSLGIKTSLVLELGSPLGNTSMAEELHVPDDMQIQNSGPGIIIRPSEPVSLKNPLSISLPVPLSSNLNLAGLSFAILFKSSDPETQKLISGLIPADGKLASIEFDEKSGRDVVKFSGYFGAYWVVQISRPFLASEIPPKVESKEPIINSKNTMVMTTTGMVKETEIVVAQSLPSYELGLPTLVFDTVSRKATLAIRADSHFKSCRIDIYEKTTDAKGISADLGASFSWTGLIEKITEHTLVGRFRCTDENTKVVTSAWTSVITIPAVQTAPVVNLPLPTLTSLAFANVALDSFINNAEKTLTTSLWTLTATDYTSARFTTALLDSNGTLVCDVSKTYSQNSAPSPASLTADGVYVVCVELQNAVGGKVFGKSLAVTRDTVVPTVTSLTLVQEAIDGQILANELISPNPLFAVTASGASVIDFTHMLNNAGGTLVCDASKSYTLASPPSASMMNIDGAFAACVRLRDPALNTIYVKTPGIVRNSTPLPIFETTWQTANTGVSNSLSVKLPLVPGGSYNFTVDWGDGVSNHISTWNAAESIHSYSTNGIYTVRIQGTLVGWQFADAGDQRKLLSISKWGSVQLGAYGANFAGAHNLQITATDTLNLTGTSSLNHMFADCYSLTNIPNISSWNISSVTSLYAMFQNANQFNGNLNNWNVGAVSDFGSMFQGASSFNQPLNNWNVQNANYMNQMFEGASSFSQPLSGWNVQNVMYMNSMFKDASAFNMDISAWNTASLVSMESMFYGASLFNQSIGTWDTSSVTNMERLFQNAVSFNKSLNTWDMSSVQNTSQMFMNAQSFNGAIGSWNTSSVTAMAEMFRGAIAFNQLISSWDVSNVNDMSSMFENASAFNLSLSSWNVLNVERMTAMFRYATTFNQPLNSWNTSKVRFMDHMFEFAVNFNQPLNSWPVLLVEDMASMFACAYLFNQPLNSWNTSSVTNMSNMFIFATSFNGQIDSWNVTKVVNARGMFRNAESFNQPLNGWYFQNLNDMGMMFLNAYAYNQNMSSWYTGKVRFMEFVFSNAVTFNGDISTWNTSKVFYMTGLFSGAAAFNGNIGSWDISLVQNMDEMFSNATSFTYSIENWMPVSALSMQSMFTGTSIPTTNYTNMINKWNTLALQSGVIFNAGNSMYGSSAAASRANLINNKSWTIIDNGVSP
ncbi:MAG: BspA family leucine-rich repeat surface protein [Proteobacteria bacterium]|nr:MAG: BspA family leucine-rich repeat surface protein [Pseudomonadota bacterium]